MLILRPDTLETIKKAISDLRSIAQNDEMIDSYFTETGKILNRVADELERHIEEAPHVPQP